MVSENEERKMENKLRVGILGATGMVGQRFIALLENHPWFEVVTVAASPRSAGKTYEEAVGGRWKMDTPMPEAVKNLVVMNVNDVEHVASTVDFVFSAVDMTKDEIKKIEEEYAKTETPVVSNNSAHRWTPDVPMVVPEINPEHFEVIEHQKKRLGTTRGFVAVKPNCSIQSYAPVLTAWKEFEPYEVIVTTYQAISGAGKNFKDWPEMVENIIPFIDGDTAQVGPQVAEKLGLTQITYAEEILEVGDGKIKVKRHIDGGVETVEGPLPIVITVNGSAAPCRPRNAKLVQKYKHAKTVTEKQQGNLDYTDLYDKRDYLNLVEWSVADVNGDLAQCGLSGSPTKVKAIQNIVFQAKESKTISGSDRDVEDLIVELLANHTIG